MASAYLGVKWVELELVFTLELLGVQLLESHPVVAPFEDVDFLLDVLRALSETSLPGHGHFSLVLAHRGLAVLRVLEYNKGNPQLVDFIAT